MAGGALGRQGYSMSLTGKVQFVQLTDTGKVRSHNEDSIACSEALGLAVLADGMGGYRGGEVASAIAVSTIMAQIRAALERPRQPQDSGEEIRQYTPESELVRESIAKANESVYEMATSQPQYRGMGTTIVVAMFYDDRLTVGHVGDSRLYRLAEGRLEQLTRDHTLLQELIDRGFYTNEEARESLNKNLVTRALGIEATVEPDLQEEVVREGDIFLICSDGLNDAVSDEDIRLTLQRFGANLEQAAEELVKIANENGGKDNISVILVKVLKSFPAPTRWLDRIVDWFD
jgi:serine/threonine protein phosphatase PrpC